MKIKDIEPGVEYRTLQGQRIVVLATDQRWAKAKGWRDRPRPVDHGQGLPCAVSWSMAARPVDRFWSPAVIQAGNIAETWEEGQARIQRETDRLKDLEARRRASRARAEVVRLRAEVAGLVASVVERHGTAVIAVDPDALDRLLDLVERHTQGA